MKRWYAVALASPLFATLAFGGCATNTAGEPIEEATRLPDEPRPPADAGPPDAGCDPSDPQCTAELAPCESVSWCLAPAPVDPRYALTAVAGTSESDVWAVGAGGTILHYDGSAWIPIPSGHANTFFAVWASGPKDVWVVSTPELVLHGNGFRDGAAAWENVPLTTSSTATPPSGTAPSGIRLHAVWGTSINDVRIAGMRMGTVVESPGFLFRGYSNHYAKTRRQDGSVIWRVFPAKPVAIRAIWGSAPDDVWMAGDEGAIFHGTPYLGALPHPDLLEEGAVCTGCHAGCTACAVASDSLEWTSVDSQTKYDIHALWGSSAADVWAVGERGTIRRFQDGDARWQKVESPTIETLHGVWGSGPNDVWIVGEGGTILHYDGTRLTPSSVQLPLGVRPSLRGVWGSGPNDVWIVGDRGTILHYAGPKPGVIEGGEP